MDHMSWQSQLLKVAMIALVLWGLNGLRRPSGTPIPTPRQIRNRRLQMLAGLVIAVPLILLSIHFFAQTGP
jgi:hypothetical protein